MPELPEVEVVRRGLERHVVGRRVEAVEVLHPRPIRRHAAGSVDFTARLRRMRFDAACRRGKFLWLPLAGGGVLTGDVLMGHLGMSGQMLVQPPTASPERHLRVRFSLDDGNELRFVDQRMFGGLYLSELDPSTGAPVDLAHIALDALDSGLTAAAFGLGLRSRRTQVKRALLDQTVVSGIGNIYADEALWRSRLHYSRETSTMSARKASELLGHVRDVMTDALAQGGTSFDALYVNVNGQSGYFDRSLAAYGREGRPCPRCGTPIRREAFTNRSSFFCPRCQRRR